MSEMQHEAPNFDEVLEQRFGRRTAFKVAIAGAAGAAVATAVAGDVAAAGPYAAGELTYDAVPQNGDDQITLPAGFTHDVLLSWGDPLVPGLPAFDVTNQSEADQNQRVGFNHDYVDFRPLPAYTSTASDTGLLFVNHEYTDSSMMFEAYNAATVTQNQVDVELAAHGASIVKVSRAADGSWSYDPSSAFNRRITAKTPITLSGPVAGDARVQTTADPAGTTVLGMLNNCGGGNTPWGTVLTCEENFDQYFGKGGTNGAGITDPYVVKTLGSVSATVGASGRRWENFYSRFDLTVEPREYLRFGWVVEIDPYTPDSTPKKRTALGRFKHEAASGTVSTGGKFVSYSGDDQVNNYIYKFVTAGNVDLYDRANNADLLDSGTLYVARFDANGTGTWLPVTFGTGPLVSPAFDDQVDVLIRTRQAATALGATKMSRPEDVEVNPLTKKIYAVMTGNNAGETNAANPRLSGGNSITGNALGHVIEITEAGGDNAATTFTWEMFLLCGYPNATGSVATNSQPQPALLTTTADNSTYWAGYDETKVSPVARVDNVSFDHQGNMFLSTDGQPSALASNTSPPVGFNDCLVGFPVGGAERGHGKALVTAVDGCEVTGPFFTPDDRTVFVSIQHPGVDLFTWTSIVTAPSTTVGTFASPGSSWNTTPPIPGKTPGVPRPATIAIRRLDGSQIASGTVVPPPDIPEMPMPAVAVGASAIVAGLIAFRYHRMSAAES
jgi:secreted PhoX family phosphatase